MSTLNVHLGISPNLPNNTPVSVEITDEGLNTTQMMMTGPGATAVEVQPGMHLIRARFPSGAQASATTVVPEDGPSEVQLTFPHSPHEWLAWPQFLGITGRGRTEPIPGGFPPTWLRLWVSPEEPQSSEVEAIMPSSTRSWRVESLPAWQNWPEADPAAFIFSRVMSLPQPMRPRMLQMGGESIPWRLVSIPPSNGAVQVVVRPSTVPTALNGGLTVKVVSMDAKAETLLHYLDAGATDAAQGIAGEVIADVETGTATFERGPLASSSVLTDAEQMLRDKLVNPMAAAIGGYYLLGVGALERLHDWPNNFANWVDWLPDAAVIHAWQLLRTQGVGQEDRQAQARMRLVQAAQRGLPVYTSGVRLLIDGLELLEDDPDTRDSADEEVKQALRTIRGYAAAMDWSQTLSTFYGSEPTSPSPQPITGVPPDEAQLDWLKAD